MGYTIRKQRPNYVIASFKDFTVPEAHETNIARIEKTLQDSVKFVESDNIRYQSLAPNDPRYTDLYGHNNVGQTGGTTDADIDAPEAWDTRTDASSIIVAVTDTGINYTHEDIAANMWTHPVTGEHGINAVEDNFDPDDDDGHGTHVAGTIGAVGNNGIGVTGVAWNVQLMACRGLGPQGGTTTDLADTIIYAHQNGAHLINASWGGGGPSALISNAIADAGDDGVTFVAAAGNDSVDNDLIPHYPSSYALDNIVAVASLDDSDRLSDFSCWGLESVDIAGHGSDILSTWIGSDSAYNTISGTSMATPQVCGALALAYAEFPAASKEEIIARLYTFVNPVPTLNSLIATGGRLDLELLLSGSTEMTNDNLADAQIIPDMGGSFKVYNMMDATREDWEDSQSVENSGSHSVWYQWTAPYSGSAVITTRVTYGPFSITLFDGADRNTWQRMHTTAGIQTINPKTRFTIPFSFEEGKTYTFMVDANDTERLNRSKFSLFLYPENDLISHAIELSDPAFSVSGSNLNGTLQHFEIEGGRDAGAIDHGFGNGFSVWWTWQAPFTGSTTFTATGPAGTGVAIYKGWPLTAGGTKEEGPWQAVSEQTTAGNSKTVDVEEGTIYYIVIDSTNPGALTLTNTPATTLLATTTTGNGALSQSLVSAEYYTGDVVEFTPTPAPGWSFGGWQGVDSINSTQGTASVTMSTNRQVSATFVQTLDDWKALHFGEENVASTLNGDDPDKDGLSNLQEYLHGSDPLDASSYGRVESHLTEDCLCIIYWKNIGAVSPLNIVPEHSSDMSNWLTEGLSEQILETTPERVKIKAMLPMSDGSQGFIRLNYAE